VSAATNTPSSLQEWDPPRWRAHALSVVYDHLPHKPTGEVPSLTLLCLRILFSSFSGSEFIEEILPYIPSHLRRDLLRYTSIHSPLANPRILCQPDGYVDGELIVVDTSLRRDYFRAGNGETGQGDEEGLSWDSPAHDNSSTSLHTLVLLSVYIPNAAFLTLPPTITHLALISLPYAVPLHRLPGICPLITVLDLSYNVWLGTGTDVLGKVGWGRWSRLEVLGLRGCCVSEELRRNVNEGKWTDVVIVQ
jgi:hypothetical protein